MEIHGHSAPEWIRWPACIVVVIALANGLQGGGWAAFIVSSAAAYFAFLLSRGYACVLTTTSVEMSGAVSWKVELSSVRAVSVVSDGESGARVVLMHDGPERAIDSTWFDEEDWADLVRAMLRRLADADVDAILGQDVPGRLASVMPVRPRRYVPDEPDVF